MSFYPHQPVLLEKVLDLFEKTTLHIFLDGTLGAGGHAEAILKAHPEIKTFIGIDQDPDALAIAQARLAPWKDKLRLYHANFSQMGKIIAEYKPEGINGMLVDLGVSSMQLDRPERGFSFSKNGPLDMRMDPSNTLTAAEIVNTWSEGELGKLFRDLGEEPRWRLAASLVVAARKNKPLETTADLAEALKTLSWNKKKGINPLTLIFQGLRIAVNKELDVLEQFLHSALDHLAPKGRLAVISFHSLEDRLVKNHMRLAASDKWETSGLGGIFRDKAPEVRIVTKKPLVAAEEEVKENPRSRSAKLRCVEKIESNLK